MKRLFGGRKRLCKSQSVQNEKSTRNRKKKENADDTVSFSMAAVESTKPSTSSAANGVISCDDGGTAGVNGGETTRFHAILLTPSRTFDASKCYRSNDSAFASGASTHSEELRFDAELDRSMMQTITDVKYVNRRPKFTAVVDANFQRQCFEAHNLVRQKYGSPALIWSQELADLAKTWALKLAERGRVLYPELPGIGENIYMVSDKTGNHLTTGAELVALWCAEADHFDFSKPRWSLRCKNFTQLLWRSSIEMGVARYWNMTKNCLAIVAFYRPGGNQNAPGEFSINLPSKAELSEDTRFATQLDNLVVMLNRSTLNDGGFKSPANAAQSHTEQRRYFSASTSPLRRNHD